MKVSTTTAVINRYFETEDVINILAQAGFDAIDFSFCNYIEKRNSEQAIKEYFYHLKSVAESKGVYFNQAHAVFHSSCADSEEWNKKRFNEIVQNIKCASYLGINNIVVHPCQHLEHRKYSEELFEYNMDFYSKLIPYCEEYGIRIAIENMWQYSTKIIHSTCSRPSEFIRYIDTLNSPWIVGCLDIGHTMLVSEDPASFIRALGNKRLQCLHIHDVDGEHDSHTLPYLGIINWEEVMEALGDIGYTGDITFEAHEFFANRPKELIASCAQHMAQTGKVLAKMTGLY